MAKMNNLMMTKKAKFMEKTYKFKTNPEIYLMACKSLNLKPEECAAIEDSLNGLKSAKAAGMYTIMVPDRIQPNEETEKVSDCILKNLGELKNLF